ncbi:MAG: DUF456 domain-containing protein [Spirochaetales bacterium]|nr:DUF456 domain-containing protein [Spirochaetales bacterium]
MLEILLIVLGVLFLIVGFAGCIIPIIPGPPIAYGGLVLLHLTDSHSFSTSFLIFWAAAAVGVTILDNFIPLWSTRRYGGSRRAVWGSAIGLLLGMFIFPPFGIIIGPFFGAAIGELSGGLSSREALRSGFGAFMGFLGGVLLKTVSTGMIIFYFFQELI